MLRRIFDLRAGEGPLALKTFGVLFGLIAGHTVLETSRDALFLRTLPASRLAFVYIALALLGLVVPAYNSRFVRNFGRRNALVFTLMLAATGTVVWHFQRGGAALAYGLYLWSGLIGTVMVVQFWMFAGQLFTLSQSKRLFSGVASGGVLGAVAGGVVATGALEVLMLVDTEFAVAHLLLVSAALFLATAMLLTTIASDDQPASRDAARASSGIADGLAVLRDHPYVRRIAAFVALSTVTVLVTDYLFKLVAKAEVEPALLGPFFARYYAVLNAAALVMQLLLAQRIVQRVGVVAALAILPLLLLLGGAGVALMGSVFGIVLLTKGADGALRHSLHRVASELLYLPLPEDVRDRCKALLDAVFVRGAQALTAGAILALSALGLESVRLLGSAVAVLAACWIVLTLGMKSGYLDLFRRGLGRGSLDPRLLRFEELDIDSVESVMAALSSPEPERVVAAIQLLRDAQRSRLIPALILYHESDEVLLAALDVVAKNDEQQWRPHAVRLLRTRSEAVRVAALRALGRVCEADLVREGLDDPSPAVQTHAAFQLARCAGTDQPEEHPAVIGMLARVRAAPLETRRQMRLALLEALRVDADERWADVMLDIAESDRTPEVVDALAHALVRIVDERFIPLLISWLDLRQARSAVRDALVKLGSPALGALEAALGDASTPDAVRRQIPITIAEFGTQPAADMLVVQLTRESEGLVRYRVLRALSRIRNSHAVRVDTAIIQAEVVRNLREHLRLLALSVPLDDHALPDNARASVLLLKGLISDKMRQALERASRLFKVLYPKEDVRGVFIALRSADRHARANALEFLDALALDCSDECRELLRLATEDSSIHERLARAAAYIPARPTTSSEAIAQLLEDDDEALVALTVYHAHVVDEALDEVDALIAERPSLAYAATAALSQPPPSLAALSEAIDG